MTHEDLAKSALEDCEVAEIQIHILVTRIEDELHQLQRICGDLDGILGASQDGPMRDADHLTSMQDMDLLMQSLGDLGRVFELIRKTGFETDVSVKAKDLAKILHMQALRDRLLKKNTPSPHRLPGVVDLF